MEPVLNASGPIDDGVPPSPVTTPHPASWNWLKFELTACAVLGGIAGASFLWLMSLPPPANCQQMSPLTPDIDRLYCAQQAAQSGELPKVLAGLKLIEQWPPDHPLYAEAQRWMKTWSQSVLSVARQKMAQSDRDGAIALVKQIPPMSPVYREAQAALADWQKRWQGGDAIVTAVQQALREQQWDQATTEIARLRDLNDDHWRSQANALTQQLLNEQRARKLLNQAQQLVATGSQPDLSTAMVLIGQIDRATQTWSVVSAWLQPWSERLLALSEQQWQQGQLTQAMTTARNVALDDRLTPEAERLFWLSQAQQWQVSSLSDWQVTSTQPLQLLGAIAIAQQIPPESRFYAKAQARIKVWQAHLQDVTQLQIAQFLASFGQPLAQQLAIAQANQIDANRPRRRQAQTLIAYWRTQLQQVEDGPLLATARTLAAQKTISALKAAIGQTQSIRQGHSLYAEANRLRRLWQIQVETLEDQPLLDRANATAQRGHLGEAIQLAARIGSGRALYAQAQDAIATWEAQRQAVSPAQLTNSPAIAVTRTTPSPTPRPAPTPPPPSTAPVSPDTTVSSTSPIPALNSPTAVPIRTFPKSIDEIRLPPKPTPVLPSGLSPATNIAPPESINVTPSPHPLAIPATNNATVSPAQRPTARSQPQSP